MEATKQEEEEKKKLTTTYVKDQQIKEIFLCIRHSVHGRCIYTASIIQI